jgi:hypothetical protein
MQIVICSVQRCHLDKAEIQNRIELRQDFDLVQGGNKMLYTFRFEQRTDP